MAKRTGLPWWEGMMKPKLSVVETRSSLAKVEASPCGEACGAFFGGRGS